MKLTYTLISCIPLILFNLVNDLSLKNKLEAAKDKMKSMKVLKDTAIKKYRTESIRFIPTSELEYPGMNKEKLQKIKMQWEQFYNCQQLRLDSLWHVHSTIAEAVGVLKGDVLRSVELI